MKMFGKDLDKTVPIIAEIGVNHEGSVGAALKLISLAYEAGADAVKFQSYTPERYISNEDDVRFNRINKFHINQNDHIRLIKYANKLGISFFSTPLTEDWVTFLSDNTSVIKIASGDLTFEPVIKKAAQSGKKVILSTGGANINEVNTAISWFKRESKSENIENKLVLMHCVSAYPTPLEHSNLNSIKYLKDKTGLRVGYSNHVKGLVAPILAIALGADIIEVHFTDSRDNRTFHDHHLSLNPDELSELCKINSNIKSAYGKYDKFCSTIEKENLSNLRKGIVAIKNIEIGHIVTDEDLIYARPSKYIDSSQRNLLIGKKAKKYIEKGSSISFDMLE